MQIRMVGIDHNQAPVDVRARFSVTTKRAQRMMQELKQREDISGILILSTCNRMELWASVTEDFTDSLTSVLCRQKHLDTSSFQNYFRERSNREAITHLFYLACGLKSQVVGEDQIITQIGNATELARENNVLDSFLEVLFRQAITAAKKVKTEVYFPKRNPSSVEVAVCQLKEDGYCLKNKKALVIGNGQIGQLAVSVLLSEGADVTMTVRPYRHGSVRVQKGCHTVSYEERGSALSDYDYVISGTSSPHLTVSQDMIESVTSKKLPVFVDLAVPRDIAVSIGERAVLYDIDDFQSNLSDIGMSEVLDQIRDILDAQMEEFYIWVSGKESIAVINHIKEEAAKNMMFRMKKILRESDCGEPMETAIEMTTQKVVNQLLFGLKKQLKEEEFIACLKGLEQLYEE